LLKKYNNQLKEKDKRKYSIIVKSKEKYKVPINL